MEIKEKDTYIDKGSLVCYTLIDKTDHMAHIQDNEGEDYFISLNQLNMQFMLWEDYLKLSYQCGEVK